MCRMLPMSSVAIISYAELSPIFADDPRVNGFAADSFAPSRQVRQILQHLPHSRSLFHRFADWWPPGERVPGAATLRSVLAALLAGLLLLQQTQVDVALDPGHSTADVGASGGGLREYQLTFDLAQRVKARLESAHLSVRMTREDNRPLTPMLDPAAT